MKTSVKNNKLFNDKNKVAVLYSPGYGAGWYTWNQNHIDILYSPEIVQKVLDNKRDEITEEFVNKVLEIDKNTDSIYCGGSRSLEVEWMDEGTHFTIDEYDGFESIIYLDDLKLIA